MEALRSAAVFAAGALVAQYGVRGGLQSNRAFASAAASPLSSSSPPTSAAADRVTPPSSTSSSTAAAARGGATQTSSSSIASARATAADRLAACVNRDDAWTYVAAAAAIAAAGAVAAAAHAAAGALLAALADSLIFQAEIDSRDDAYRWLMLWLSRHRAVRRASRVSVTTSLRAFGTSADGGGDGGGLDGDDDNDEEEGGGEEEAEEEAAAAARGAAAGGGAGAQEEEEQQLKKTIKRLPVALLPAPGTHRLWHEGRLFVVSRRRAPGNPHSPSNARLLSETLVIRTARGRCGAAGRSNAANKNNKKSNSSGRAAVLALLARARDAYAAHARGSTLVFGVDSTASYWEQAGSRPRRPLASVVLPGEGDGTALLADARRFLASRAFYARRGLPYRRGFLLFGPPGTGKSSLVAALAGALGLEVYVVTLSSPSLTDDGLRALLNAASPRACLLLEDVDAAFASREAGEGEGGEWGGKGTGKGGKSGGGGAPSPSSPSPSSKNSLTLAGLLNAIDGVAAQEGRLLFLTTNHPGRLDPALVRPGRVDVRVPFARASRSQLRRMFAHFFSSSEAGVGVGGVDAALAARFANALPEGALSLAEVQGLLLLHRDDPRAAVEAAEAGALAA